MTEKVKRNKFKSYLDTTPSSTPTWSLMGDGITTGKVNLNPKTTEEIYITQDTAAISVDSYAPNMPIEQTAKINDPVFEFIFDLYQNRKVLADAETDVLHVYLFQTAYHGWYPAEKQTVAIAIDDFGGDGGQPAKINYTLNYNGDAILGWYNIVDDVFIATDDIVTTLATLVFSGITLTPTFSAGVITYTGPTSTSTATITATPTDDDATVIITNGVTVIANAGTATWVTGANVVTVQVLVGDVSTTYTATITKS